MELTFKIEIAGVSIAITSDDERIYNRCKDYLTDKSADMAVNVNEEHLKKIREEENTANRGFVMNKVDAEFVALYRLISEKLIEKNVLAFHGSALSLDGQGVIFVGISGAGKSTHAALWRKVFGERVTAVNDDKPFIRFDGEEFYVCGSPWAGKEHIENNTQVPLRAIIYINQSKTNTAFSLGFDESLRIALQQSYRPRSAVIMKKTLDYAIKLCENINFYSLSCDMSEEAALTAYRAVFG
ncbi:MAG: hypothetical protein K6B52_03040 [Clostridiales bacterium]|nr:hypothetical protein [Clostridiales bacterium]